MIHPIRISAASVRLKFVQCDALGNLRPLKSKSIQHPSFEEMTLVVESIVGRGVDGKETLRGTG